MVANKKELWSFLDDFIDESVRLSAIDERMVLESIRRSQRSGLTTD
jgi:hypothetical protein